jgi:hypothetical protein
VAGRSSTMSPLNIGAGDGYEDDIFEEVGAQLTIEEIVNQRFEEAERRSGQIITILYDLLLVWVRLDTYRS